jgi:hypothetical protein
LALHAAELGFVHPVSGKQLRFQAALPDELADFWRQLKYGRTAKPTVGNNRQAKRSAKPRRPSNGPRTTDH